MKHLTNITVSILVLTLLVFFSISGHAKDLSREQISEYGFIDWLNQKVYATGVGIAPQDKENPTQAKTLAYRAAVVVAQRNLLEVIKGVHIDSETIIGKRIITDDKIVSKIEGIIRFSRIESSQVLEDDAVSVTLSMPLGGRMGEVLVSVIEGTGTPLALPPSRDLTERLLHLENRVTALENQLSRLNDISVEQKSVIQLLTYLVEAWQHDTDRGTRILQVGFASDEETAALRHQMNEQEKQMASMAIHLNDLAHRLADLERDPESKKTPQKPKTQTKTHPYTGLIVDARDTGFKPSLRPELFHQGQLIYPGSYLNLSDAVRNGYVRYYNNRFHAQQSERVGALPYATKATGTQGGDRGLSIDDETFQMLRAVLQDPDNFLVQCRVVIIF
ncbi:hypothetical protein ACFL2E_01565 [Thermodesulfobacteriota bacterium]